MKKFFLIIILIMHMPNLDAWGFKSAFSSVKSGVQTVAQQTQSGAVNTYQGSKELAKGNMAGGASDLGTGVTQLALSAGEISVAPQLAGALAAAGAVGGGKIANQVVSGVGSMGTMIGGAVGQGIVGTGQGVQQVGKGTGQLLRGQSKGFENIGKGVGTTITQASNIASPLPINLLMPGFTEGIQRAGHGAAEVAQGHVGAGVVDIGSGTAEGLMLGSSLKGVEKMGTGINDIAHGQTKTGFQELGSGALQGVPYVSLNEGVTGVSDIVKAVKDKNVGEAVEGLSRTVAILPVVGRQASEAAMGFTKAGEAITAGLMQGQGASALLAGLGAGMTGAATYGEEEFQGTSSEAELTGEADTTGGDGGDGGDAGALPAFVNDLPGGFTLETGTTFCVAVGSRNGQYEAWTISPPDPADPTGATKLLRYNAQEIHAKNPWQIIPAVDDQGNKLVSLIWVSVSSDGELMIIDNQGIVYQYDWDNKNFTALPISYAYTYDKKQSSFIKATYGLALNYVSIGNKNTIWGVDASANIIYSYDPQSQTWTPSTPGIRVSAGVDGTVVGIDPTGAAIEYTAQGWNAMPGTQLDHITVGSKDYIFGSFQANMWQYVNNTWTQILGTDGSPAQGINEIVVNAAGSLVMTDLAGNIYNKGEDAVVITQQATDVSE